MFLYLLQITDEGGEHSPSYVARNNAMVVRAENAQHARSLASGVALDEPEAIWLNGRFSTCRRIGVVPAAGCSREAGVVLQSDNVS